VGKRGPLPKSAALKKREGTYRKDRARAAAQSAGLELPSCVPTCPPSLSKAAKAVWTKLIADGEEWREILSKVDALGLELIAKHMVLERKYLDAAEREPIVKTPFGPKVNPAAAAATKEAKLVESLLDKFGLTPARRPRMGGPAKPAASAATTDGTPLVGPGLRAIDGGKAGG
jgi:P27 family predicted phage terminase small subunit